MSFYAQNDRIWITDTNGDVAFDTNRDMPHIIAVSELTVSKRFDYAFSGLNAADDYGNQTVTSDIMTVQGKADFVLIRGTPSVYNNGTGKAENAIEPIDGYPTAWMRYAPAGEFFFQGSAMLEIGSTVANQAVAQYARRAIHVYPVYDEAANITTIKLAWQSSTAATLVKTSSNFPYWKTSGDKRDVTWTLALKLWIGKFR